MWSANPADFRYLPVVYDCGILPVDDNSAAAATMPVRVSSGRERFRRERFFH